MDSESINCYHEYKCVLIINKIFATADIIEKYENYMVIPNYGYCFYWA